MTPPPRPPGPPRPPRRPRRRPGGADPGPRPVGDSLDDVLRALVRERPRPTGAPAPPAGPGAHAPEGTPPPPAPPPPAPPASAATWGTIFSRWEELVGEALARHARPLRLEDGALVVAVDRPPWATQVRALAGDILARVREETGEPLERLVVVVRA